MEIVHISGAGITRAGRPLHGAAELLRFWNTEAILDEGVSLGDLMGALAEIKDMERLEELLGCSVTGFLKEVGTVPSVESLVEDDIDFLEIYNMHYPQQKDLNGSIAREFRGWGRWPVEEGGGHGAISIEFMPLPDLMRHPLRYNPRLELYADDRAQTWSNIVARISIGITLGEILRAVWAEIGLHGTPENRDMAALEVEREIEKLEQDLPNGGTRWIEQSGEDEDDEA